MTDLRTNYRDGIANDMPAAEMNLLTETVNDHTSRIATLETVELDSLTAVQDDPAPKLGANLILDGHNVGDANPADLSKLHAISVDSATINALATQTYVETAVNDLIGGAPGMRDTLKELSDALDSDESALAAVVINVNSRALDSAVVHNTGAETIAGAKTFSASPIVPDATTSSQAASKGQVDAVAATVPTLAKSNPTAALTLPAVALRTYEIYLGVGAAPTMPTAVSNT